MEVVIVMWIPQKLTIWFRFTTLIGKKLSGYNFNARPKTVRFRRRHEFSSAQVNNMKVDCRLTTNNSN